MYVCVQLYQNATGNRKNRNENVENVAVFSLGGFTAVTGYGQNDRNS
jgi:hypothetical protein